MKSILTKLFGCIVTISLIMLGIFRLNYLVRPVDTDKTFRRIYAFHDLPQNSVEVMIYGSSHAFLGINPLVLYRKYGIGSYNYGTNWEKINTLKLFLKDSLKTQSPELAVIETYNAGHVLCDTDITAEIFYTRYLDPSPDRTHFLKQCFGNDPERWLSYYMPLCAFHDNWTNITRSSFLPLMKSGKTDRLETIRKYMGFAPYKNVTRVTLEDPSEIIQKPFSKSAIKELDDIVAVCRERGIEILFVTVPYQSGYPYDEAMKKYAQENNCEYINLFYHIEEMGLNEKKDFRDIDHLNKRGAAKVSEYLGKFISEHYDLSDMRKTEGNMWER